jgi:3-hydroxyisobutyrate dehydrogenase
VVTNPIKPQIAFLGAGLMGAPMIARLAGAGYLVHVWNRTRAKADAIEHVLVADTPAEAAADAAIVITMLLDADAVDAAMSGEHGALSAMADDDVWIQMSTVGLDGAYRLAQLAEDAGVAILDAPVVGTRKPAEDGALKILASGPPDLVDRCRPVFEVFGTVVDGLGEAGAGSRLKLAVNAWVFALTDATAASLTLAGNLGLDPRLFLSVIEGSATDSPYAHVKGRQMLDGDFSPSFALGGAAKDAKLIEDACRSSHTDSALIAAIRGHFEAAVEAGHTDDDMASVFVAHRSD